MRGRVSDIKERKQQNHVFHMLHCVAFPFCFAEHVQQGKQSHAVVFSGGGQMFDRI